MKVATLPDLKVADLDIARHRARETFLRLLAAEVPASINELGDLMHLVPALEAISLKLHTLAQEAQSQLLKNLLPEELRSWANRFHLGTSQDDWLLLVALDSLLHWDLVGTSSEDLERLWKESPWAGVGPPPTGFPPHPRAFRMPMLVATDDGRAHFDLLITRAKWARLGSGSVFLRSVNASTPLRAELEQSDPEIRHETVAGERWDPFYESWGRFAKRLMFVFQRALARHKRRRLAEATSFGATPSSRGANETHLRWLIRYQVLGQSFREIARGHRRPGEVDNLRRAVGAAARAAATQIGLGMRSPSRGGRPPASSSGSRSRKR